MAYRARLTGLTLSVVALGCAAPHGGDGVSKNASPPTVATANPVASRGTAAPIPPPPASRAASGPPPRREIVVDDSFGLKIVDPYRWMEQPDNAELTQWMKSEGASARQALDGNPGRAALFARNLETGLGVAAVSWIHVVGDRLFYLRTDKGGQLRKLVMRSADGAEHILVDPSVGPPTGTNADESHSSIDHYAASPDGKLVAYGLARGGGEIATEHILETATGRERDEPIPHIWGEFAPSWFPDSKGFFYTQIPAAAFSDPSIDKLQNIHAYSHTLGEPIAKDVVLLGPGVNAKVSVEPRELPDLWSPLGSRWVVATMGGSQSEERGYVALLSEVAHDTAWRRICDYADEVSNIEVHGDSLFLQSRKGAPNGRILRVPANAPVIAKAVVALPESDAIIELSSAAADALYVSSQKGGRSTLRRVVYSDSHSDSHVEDVPLPFEGWIDSIRVDERRPGAIIVLQGWTHESTFYSFDPKTRAFTELPLKPKTDADFTSIVADETSVSNGGVDIPLTILHRRDLALDGSHPTVVTGYGAYGLVETPRYRADLLPWLERGGVWAVAHVRGGGEKGEAWRKGAWRETKPNGWRDFNACAEWLIQKGFTSKAKLAAYGASAGGILVGRAITERPDLYAAAALYAGVVNTTRYRHGSNGANQLAELGPDDTAEGMKALLAMDAYQNVKDGVPYPALMLSTGLNDARVSPWMSAKLAARMKAATTSGRPILLRVEGDEGHGVGSKREQRLANLADMESFFLEQMGDPAFKPAPTK